MHKQSGTPTLHPTTDLPIQRTSPPPYDRVSLLFGWCAAFGGVYCLPPWCWACWHSSGPSLSAKSTIAVRCWPVSPVISLTAERCSSADFLGVTVGSHHSNSTSPWPALVVGPRADTVPTPVYWHFVACTAQLRHTSPKACNKQPLSKPVVSRHLCSADTLLLTVPPIQRSTLGDRSFPTAAARSWNRLPASIQNASSVATFRRHLKNHLFWSSYYTN